MYIRPILEYSSTVCNWAPHIKCSIDKLEAVQRWAAIDMLWAIIDITVVYHQ